MRDAELLDLREDVAAALRWLQIPPMVSTRRAFGTVLAPAAGPHPVGRTARVRPVQAAAAARTGASGGGGGNARGRQCKFFVAGSCRFGSRCKNVHAEQAGAAGAGGNARPGRISAEEAARRRAESSSVGRRSTGQDLAAAARAAS